MISFIIKELRERLENNDWMEPETKEKATKKLDKIDVTSAGSGYSMTLMI